MYDLIVIGGGAIGLSCAVEEISRGKRVCLIERYDSCRKASWASAGILATRGARRFYSTFREFCVRSICLYPQWLQKISQLAGEEITACWGGDYVVFRIDHEQGREQLAAMRERLQREEAVDFAILEQAPPFLAPALRDYEHQVIHFPREGFVDNRRLLLVLTRAFIRQGGEYLANTQIEGLVEASGAVEIHLADRIVRARHCLVAAGAWSNDILRYLGITAPLVAVKGQMFRIEKWYSGDCMLRYFDDLYLVPNGDSLIVGATTEPRVWAEDFDEVGEDYLQRCLADFLPQLQPKVIERWAGIRPRTRDRRPLMGFVNDSQSISICCGHYKNGVGMAPLAAICMSKMLNGENLPLDVSGFAPWRKKGLVTTLA